jgi:hypothetical protein
MFGRSKLSYVWVFLVKVLLGSCPLKEYVSETGTRDIGQLLGRMTRDIHGEYVLLHSTTQIETTNNRQLGPWKTNIHAEF